MSRTVILIGIGGFLGSICRYFTANLFNKLIPSVFPFGTFAANFLGCFILGLVYGISERYNWLSPEIRFFMVTGFCGGYTTFSAFAYENVKFLESSNYIIFATYSVLSFVVGLLAVYFGLSITKL